MKLQAMKSSLWGVSGAATLGSMLAVGVAVFSPLADETREHPTVMRAALPKASMDRLPSLASLAAVWDIDLRRPLVAPLHAAAQAIAPAPMSFHLIGTTVETGHSMALFTTASGAQRLKAIGEEIDGARIVTIDRDGVNVLLGSSMISLPVERSHTAGQPPGKPEMVRIPEPAPVATTPVAAAPVVRTTETGTASRDAEADLDQAIDRFVKSMDEKKDPP